jgi:hypothetical protein
MTKKKSVKKKPVAQANQKSSPKARAGVTMRASGQAEPKPKLKTKVKTRVSAKVSDNQIKLKVRAKKKAPLKLELRSPQAAKSKKLALSTNRDQKERSIPVTRALVTQSPKSLTPLAIPPPLRHRGSDQMIKGLAKLGMSHSATAINPTNQQLPNLELVQPTQKLISSPVVAPQASSSSYLGIEKEKTDKAKEDARMSSPSLLIATERPRPALQLAALAMVGLLFTGSLAYQSVQGLWNVQDTPGKALEGVGVAVADSMAAQGQGVRQEGVQAGAMEQHPEPTQNEAMNEPVSRSTGGPVTEPTPGHAEAQVMLPAPVPVNQTLTAVNEVAPALGESINGSSEKPIDQESDKKKIQAMSAQFTAVRSPLNGEFTQVKPLGLYERLNFWSSYLETNKEGRMKVMSAASGQKVDDIAPLIPKEYNCTTFLETVIALSRSENQNQFLKNLIAVRYQDSKPGFLSRNHFPEADWLPNNQKSHLISDITHDVAKMSGVASQTETKKIDRGAWLATQVKNKQISRGIASISKSNEEWSKPVEASVPYIRITDLKKVLGKIPEGAILSLVHNDEVHHPVLITHQGIVVRKGSQLYLRHASTGGLIRTSQLENYLGGLLKKQKPHSKWPLVGFNLNQINS